MEEKKKFISEVDLNKTTKACSPCRLECEKIKKKINNRKLSEIGNDDIDRVINVFDLKS